MLPLVIGEFCQYIRPWHPPENVHSQYPSGFAVGFILRYLLHNNPNSLGIYIIEDMFILLSVS
jgi:hypothetical protein